MRIRGFQRKGANFVTIGVAGRMNQQASSIFSVDYDIEKYQK